MEESRCKSRVLIQDPVYDQIQEVRHQKHLETIQKLRTFDRKSNSHYLVAPYRAQPLDKAKRLQAEIQSKIFPPDFQFRNCARRIQQIQNSYTKLPKITTIKLYENRSQKNEQQQRIDKQNKILSNKMAHLSMESEKKRSELLKFIQNYESYKKISRRNKSAQKEQQPVKE